VRSPADRPVPLARQILCVQRELRMRRRVYPRLIAAEKLTARLARRELAAMEAVERPLPHLLDGQQLSLFPQETPPC